MAEAEQNNNTFCKLTYSAVLDQLLDSPRRLMPLYSAQQQQRLYLDLWRKPYSLLERLRKAKKEEHLQDTIIMPKMVGSMVGVYNGKTFRRMEIKLGIIASHSSHFIPLNQVACLASKGTDFFSQKFFKNSRN
uniref:40S ribosomal protein S15 n=2 Tax=Ursus TaxID=9639 RepID=A0A452TPK5_URSMA